MTALKATVKLELLLETLQQVVEYNSFLGQNQEVTLTLSETGLYVEDCNGGKYQLLADVQETEISMDQKVSYLIDHGFDHSTVSGYAADWGCSFEETLSRLYDRETEKVLS